MQPKHLEQSVYDLEGIRIVVRANAGHQCMPYSFQRMAANNASITEWLTQRVLPSANGAEVEVVNGFGGTPHGRTKLSTVRESYAT